MIKFSRKWISFHDEDFWWFGLRKGIFVASGKTREEAKQNFFKRVKDCDEECYEEF